METNLKPSRQSMAEEKILKITEQLLLSETHEIVKSVLNDEIKTDTLIIDSTNNAFEEEFLESDVINKFLEKLGKHVKNLTLHVQAPFNLALYFNNLRKLSVSGYYIFEHLQPELFERNDFEIVSMKYAEVIDCVSNVNEPLISKNLLLLLQYSNSLKEIDFGCKIPLEIGALSAIFADFNYQYWNMDKITIDCDPLPCWTDYENYFWIIEGIRIEIYRNNEIQEVMIRPIRVVEELMEDKEWCESTCALSHRTFKSGSVKSFGFRHRPKCNRYFRSCFESFPFIEELPSYFYIDDTEALIDMSKKLQHLTDCRFMMSRPSPNIWPAFPKLQKINVKLSKMSYESCESFVKSCPNLASLWIEVYEGLTDDECVTIILEHLKDLQILYIKFESSKLTLTGLNLIGNNLKELKELWIQCPERNQETLKLFDKLPKLQKIHSDPFSTEYKRQDYFHQRSLKRTVTDVENMDTNEPLINMLPQEMLIKIFTYLTKNDQLSCRQVCKYWFESLSSSSKVDRTFDLIYSYLSWTTNPVKTFADTNFKYNRIVVYPDTVFSVKEDLSIFWKTIGREIEEILIIEHSSNLMDAISTGLIANHLPKLKKLVFHYIHSFYRLLFQDVTEWKTLLTGIEKLHFSKCITKEFDKHGDAITPYVAFSMENVTELVINGYWKHELLQLFDRITFPKLNTLILLPVPNTDKEFDVIFETKLYFHLLTNLFIGKLTQWSDSDFKLIFNNCPNLCNLGIGLSIKTFDFNCEKIAKFMFDRLDSLCGIYFVTVDNEPKAYKTFVRTGVKTLKESLESYRLFDETIMNINKKLYHE